MENRIALYSHGSTQDRNPADDYPTPAGFIHPLMDWLNLETSNTLWDPCAGGGHLVKVLRDRGYTAQANDLHYSGDDFLDETREPGKSDWIITNPPYKLGEAFVRRAMRQADKGVAMLMNSSFLEGIGRSTGLFKEHRPTAILLCNRRMILNKQSSSVFSHVWIVWDKTKEQESVNFEWLELDRAQGLIMPTGEAEGVWS